MTTLVYDLAVDATTEGGDREREAKLIAHENGFILRNPTARAWLVERIREDYQGDEETFASLARRELRIRYDAAKALWRLFGIKGTRALIETMTLYGVDLPPL